MNGRSRLNRALTHGLLALGLLGLAADRRRKKDSTGRRRRLDDGDSTDRRLIRNSPGWTRDSKFVLLRNRGTARHKVVIVLNVTAK